MTLSMLLLAVQISVWPRTVDFSAFQDLHKMMSDEFIGLFMGVVGLTRIFSLILNGHVYKGVRVGPVVRSVMAVLADRLLFFAVNSEDEIPSIVNGRTVTSDSHAE
jgi:hypothetical protein